MKNNIEGQYKKIVLESALKKIKKAKEEGYVKTNSRNDIEVYEKDKKGFVFNKKTGDITELPEQQGGTFGLSGLPGV